MMFLKITVDMFSVRYAERFQIYDVHSLFYEKTHF